MDHHPTSNRQQLLLIGAIVLTAGLTIALLTGGTSLGARQQEVADRGSEVMPFDLEATTHGWNPATDGLVQTVLADEPDDRQQIALIREHLQLETARFEDGDFTDPAAIHGDTMPGLALLRAHEGRMDITYEDVTAGARLTFTTTESELVDALHAWGKAQLSDHGSHAETN